MESDSKDWRVIFTALDGVREVLKQVFSGRKETLSQSVGSKYAPGIDERYFISKINTLQELLESRDEITMKPKREVFASYAERLDHWSSQEATGLFNSSYSTSVSLSLVLLLDDIEKFVLTKTKPVAPEFYFKEIRRIHGEINTLSSKLNNETKAFEDVHNMLSEITEAHNAAIELPDTLESLKKARNEAQSLRDEVEDSANILGEFADSASKHEKYIAQRQEEIENILKQCSEALLASTGVGLAKAFSARAKALMKQSWIWLGVLVVSLASVVGLGLWRTSEILGMLKETGIDSSLVALNMLMSLFIVAAPMWLAWIAAKRVAHLFRLVEDYEFKAAVSTSYEGYRREANKFDDSGFAEKVLGSALTRFDEPPLRFVETKDEGHPLLEMMERLFSAKWRLPDGDKKPEVKGATPKDNSEQS